MHARLNIEQLSLPIKLGWFERERTQAQAVAVDITIRYPVLPSACSTDELDDTLCYDQLASMLNDKFANQIYKLIESLAHDIFIEIKPHLHADSELTVTVTKSAPMPTLEKARFSISD